MIRDPLYHIECLTAPSYTKYLTPSIDEYLAAAGIRDEGKGPLFRSAIGKTGTLTDKPMNRIDTYRMRPPARGRSWRQQKLGCHVFRATGITAYLEAGGTLEKAQAMATHESPRTTKLYDRRGDEITLDEIERITISGSPALPVDEVVRGGGELSRIVRPTQSWGNVVFQLLRHRVPWHGDATVREKPYAHRCTARRL